MALPLTFSGVSSRFNGLPIRTNWDGFLMGASVGGLILLASATNAAYVSVRPLGVWVMTLLAAWQLSEVVFQRRAAASRSMARAVAPALRIGFHHARMEVEPPVACTPKMGFP